MHKLPIVFISIGVVIGVLALVVGFQIFPGILKKKISEQGRLVNGTDKWESWRVVPIPVFQNIYVFNVTNPNDVRQGGKPVLQELGPFVYQQRRTKVDISINEEKDTVSYRHHDDYFFREDMSQGSLSDKITVLNMPFLGTVAKASKMSAVARYMVSEIMTDEFPDEDLYVDITVDQFLFGGYFVPFIKELSDIRGEILLPNYTFGLYYNKNGSESPMYEVYAGVKDPSHFGEVVSYDGKPELEIWSEPACNKIRGHDGTTMPPFLTKDREFQMFVPGLCRNMRFVYESDVDLMGIPAYRYTIPPSHLANVKKNPENQCYCSEQGNEFENCPKDGVWELSACRQGTPMVMSFPHFYMASEDYLNQSLGLNPIQDKHEMVVVLEPTTAISLKVAMRVQMNMELKPNKYFPKLKKLPHILHPIFWMDQGVTIPPEKAQLMKDKLIKTQEIVRLGTYFVLGLGCLFIVAAVMIYICRGSSAKKQQYSTVQYSTSQYNTKKASFNKPSSFENGSTYVDPPVKFDWNQPLQNGKYTEVASPPNQRVNLPEENQSLAQNHADVNHECLETLVERGPTDSDDNIAHEPVLRTDSTPVVVAVYPKLNSETDDLPQSFLAQNNADENLECPEAPVVRNQTDSDGQAAHVAVTRTDSDLTLVVVPVYPQLSSETDNLPRSQNFDDTKPKSTFKPSVNSSSMNSLGSPFPLPNTFSSNSSINKGFGDVNNTLKDIQDTLSSYENL